MLNLSRQRRFVAVCVFSLFSSAATAQVVAVGLNNPRGIAFGPDGALYVAEAGTGGAQPCVDGPEGQQLYGTTGSITRIDLKKGTQERVATGLPSIAGPGGFAALGPNDIAFLGRGEAHIPTGLGADPDTRESACGPAGRSLARMVKMPANGGIQWLEDLGTYESEHNPTGDEVDSNPYSVLALPGKRIVADAGANALLQIDAGGGISTLAVFPNRLAPLPFPPFSLVPMDEVPTTVAQGPDGAYYVGQLTGFPFPVGGARIYRVPSTGGAPAVFRSGFTAVIDILFGPDGSLYVLEIARNGLLAAFGGGDWTGGLFKVTPGGVKTEIVVPGGLFAPGGMAMGADGKIYITNFSIVPGGGTVVVVIP